MQLLEEAAGRHSSEWEAFPRNQLIIYFAFCLAPVETCRGQRSMPIVFPSHSPNNTFETRPLTKPGTHFWG